MLQGFWCQSSQARSKRIKGIEKRQALKMQYSIVVIKNMFRLTLQLIQKSLRAKRSNLIRVADHSELIEGSLVLARDDALHRIASSLCSSQ